ncbi:MAG: SDR family NAD(P)-dependent oxidoreductase [Actinobacteria bacterium]|nr:SDR family NAD(P)-dependent oxidoreductase [Actinomycetota bacterium]
MVQRGAVVVGAGPGVGRELALILAREGYDVAVVGRRPEVVEAVAADVRAAGGTAEALLADAGDPASMAAVLRDRDARVPTEVLVYNPVMRSELTLTRIGIDDLRASLDINVVSAVAAVQAVLPSLVAAQGTLLVTGGGSALNPRAPFGVLSVGKAAQRAAVHALADELAPLGVTVRTITIAGLMDPKGPLDPRLVAEAFWALRDSDDVELVYRG